MSGTAFYDTDEGTDHMRLSFCYPTEERITEGIRRLSTVVDDELATVNLFGTARSASGSTHDGSGSASNRTHDATNNPTQG